MKKRIGILLSLILVAVLVLFCFFHSAHLAERNDNAPVSDEQEKLQKQELGHPKSPSGPTTNVTNRQVSTPSTEMEQARMEKMRQALEGKNVPIDFYGKVIDQKSNSLEGVKISAWVRHWDITSFGSSIRVQKETDSQGRFDIHGLTGDGISLEKVLKDGYELEPGHKTYVAVAGSYENPVIFKMSF